MLKLIRRILIIFVIIVYTDFFNLLPLSKVYFWGPITLFDFASLLVFAYYFIEFLIVKIKLKKVNNYNIIRLMRLFIIGVVILTITMPFRGENIMNAFQMSRRVIFSYLLIFIFVIDIYKTRQIAFLKHLIIYLGIIFSIIQVIRALSPDYFVNQLGYSYIVVAFVVQFIKMYNSNRNKFNSTLVFIILVMGLIAQPFKAYSSATILMILVFLLYMKNLRLFKYAFVFGIIFIVMVPVSSSWGKYSISFQIEQFIEDFDSKNEESAINTRRRNDEMYRIPMFLKKPLIGYGFVHPKGEYGKELGIRLKSPTGVDPYNLYSVDSGYLTFLTTFGILGTILFVFLLGRIIYIVYKSKTISIYIKQSIFIVIPVYIMVTFTHSPFLTYNEIIPFVLLLSLTTK